MIEDPRLEREEPRRELLRGVLGGEEGGLMGGRPRPVGGRGGARDGFLPVLGENIFCVKLLRDRSLVGVVGTCCSLEASTSWYLMLTGACVLGVWKNEKWIYGKLV